MFRLKFNNGNRIYYSIKDNKLVVLLAGGNKNSQAKDISLTKKLAKELHEQS
ncbi:MAG: addiction module killer protein [Bdellovibrionaceae bacterium]|nr:addiction module killer protein [Pseudobdellovibrionaceae bacterium]